MVTSGIDTWAILSAQVAARLGAEAGGDAARDAGVSIFCAVSRIAFCANIPLAMAATDLI